MNDIFSRKTDVFGGSFAADQATITFPQLRSSGVNIGADVGLLIQRLTATYQQNVTRLYEVGRPAIYYVGGRTAGDASIERVVGPRSILEAFYSTYGDVCRARSNTLNFSIATGCAPAAGSAGADLGPSERGFVDYTAYFCVITAVGLNVGAADMLINEQLRIMFSSFQYQSAA